MKRPAPPDGMRDRQAPEPLPAPQNHRIQVLPVLVLQPHSRCNCRCVMCDIWKVEAIQEIRPEELAGHADDIEALKVEWVVFSGGEPLMHSDLFRLSSQLGQRGIRTTVLSSGLLLKKHARRLVEQVDDVIVSLDGPPAVHDRIRGVPGAFDLLAAGVQELHRFRNSFPVAGRCTVQRLNAAHLRETVKTARGLGFESISFLAADLTSQAFNRPGGWRAQRQEEIGLDATALSALEAEIQALIRDCSAHLASGFILENSEKLHRIVHSFGAHLGLEKPMAPSCNAPWVSAVVEADGTVRPCFFHDPIGQLKGQSLRQVLNSQPAIDFRRRLDVSANPVCQRCVCPLRRPMA